MQAAFVVTMNVADGEMGDPAEAAQELLSLLEELGVPVISVNPWNSPGTAATTLADVARAAHAQLSSTQLPQ